MQKRVHTKTIFFKSLLIAVFGAFFFVQVQSAFIYCAYNNDFPPITTSNANAVVTGKQTTLHADKRTGDAPANFKLNKRYQAVSAQAILPAPVIIAVHATQVRTKWFTPPVVTYSLCQYTKPLRGPPSI